MNKRLLTKDELGELTTKYLRQADMPYVEAIPDEWICKAQDAKTLKAAGKWLESKEEIYNSLFNRVSFGFHIPENAIEALEQGRMPE